MITLLLQECFLQKSELEIFKQNSSASIVIQKQYDVPFCKQIRGALVTLKSSYYSDKGASINVNFSAENMPRMLIFENISDIYMNFGILVFSYDSTKEYQLVQQIQLREFVINDCIKVGKIFASVEFGYISVQLQVMNSNYCPPNISFKRDEDNTFLFIKELYIKNQNVTFDLLAEGFAQIMNFNESFPCQQDSVSMPTDDNSVQIYHCCSSCDNLKCLFYIQRWLQMTVPQEIHILFQLQNGLLYKFIGQDVQIVSPEYGNALNKVELFVFQDYFFVGVTGSLYGSAPTVDLSQYYAKNVISVNRNSLVFESELYPASESLNSWVYQAKQNTSGSSNISSLKELLKTEYDIKVQYQIFYYQKDNTSIYYRTGIEIQKEQISCSEISNFSVVVYDTCCSFNVDFQVSDFTKEEKIQFTVQLFDKNIRHLFYERNFSMTLANPLKWCVQDENLIRLIRNRKGAYKILMLYDDVKIIPLTVRYVLYLRVFLTFLVIAILGNGLIISISLLINLYYRHQFKKDDSKNA